MPSKLMKTPAQNKAIFGLGAKLGCGHEELRELAFDVTNGRTDSLKALTFDEANGMIRRLGGRAFSKPNEFRSKRSQQYDKQKTGVETIVTIQHLEKLRRIWFAKPHRTEDGLKAMCQRVIKLDKPRTTKECNKVIEAVKSMNTRERLFGTEKQEKEAA